MAVFLLIHSGKALKKGSEAAPEVLTIPSTGFTVLFWLVHCLLSKALQCDNQPWRLEMVSRFGITRQLSAPFLSGATGKSHNGSDLIGLIVQNLIT